MSVFTQNLSLATIKTVLLTTVLLATAQLITGCDSQSSLSDSNVTAQADNIDENAAKKDSASIKSFVYYIKD